MDNDKIALLRTIAQEQKKHAEAYCTARKRAGIAKVKLELLLVAHLEDIRKQKKNAGYEMSVLMLLERLEEAKPFYSEWQEQEAAYKGLEKLCEAYATRISFEQSVMRFTREGEKYSQD